MRRLLHRLNLYALVAGGVEPLQPDQKAVVVMLVVVVRVEVVSVC